MNAGRELDLVGCAQALASGALTASTLVEECLAAIARDNGALRAWTFVDAASARSAAAESDERRRRGASRGQLDGVPVAVKGNVAVKDWPLTAGLRFRADVRADDDAFVVARLRQAGAVLLGATNMDEGALGAEGANPWYGAIGNPLRSGYSPGGSSGGSAVAVAAHHCIFAIGSDTIGSVRIPAAFCGVVGLKPSHGLLSLRGVVPVHPRFDHVGPLVKRARDLPAVLGALAAYDPASPVSFPLPLAPPRRADAPRTLGYCVGFDGLSVAEEVVLAYNRGLAAMRWLGWQLVPVDLRRWDLPRLRRAILALCEREMWREHGERTTARPEDFSEGLRAFIRFGGKLGAAELAAAEERIAVFHSEWLALMDPLDAVVMPTTPCTAFPHGDRHPYNTADLTAVATGAALPAVSVPLPRSAGAMPAGLQFVGHRGAELDLSAIADAAAS
jgi:aspartyl-tRNA(Asn)/glutamyl-tRNA(Gln) amidotransferase subunit A